MATVLIVEDDPLIASFIRKALSRHGYEIEWVQSGRAALNRLGETGVDLQLLDLGLPDIDGLEVLRQLKERGDRVPVIVITSRSDPADRAIAEDLGVSPQQVNIKAKTNEKLGFLGREEGMAAQATAMLVKAAA